MEIRDDWEIVSDECNALDPRSCLPTRRRVRSFLSFAVSSMVERSNS